MSLSFLAESARPNTFRWPFRSHRVGGIFDAVRHDPVMVDEVLEALPLRPGSVVVDGTLGLGGHSMRFLERIQPGGTLIGFDWDQQMLEEAAKRIGAQSGATIKFVHSDWRRIPEELAAMGLQADAILLDLGLNSAQVDDPARGFSFSTPGPLDMRMDRTSGEPASALVNRLSIGQIGEILEDLGDEKWAVAIARKIVERRKDRPLRTTQDLVDCVLAAVPVGAREKRIHPATRTFQAFRIAVNHELEDLQEAVSSVAACLAPGGVLAILSYHSGEDRAVKRSFRELAKSGFEELWRKPSVPNGSETLRNPRSRSAKMRALKREKTLQTR